MRPLRTATALLFSAFPVFAGTVVEVKPVEVKVGGVGRESKKTLGFGSEISDDHLENFVIHAETGEISCFDCLVKW